jgi:hypothetical protein
MLAHEANIGGNRSTGTVHVLAWRNDIDLTAERGRIVPDVMPGKQPHSEIGILVAEGIAVRKLGIEPAELFENRTPDGQLTAENIERRQWRLNACRGDPPSNTVGQKTARRVRVDRSVADHSVRAIAMKTGVLDQQVRLRDHIVVEKEDNVISREPCTAIARFRRPAVGLLDDREREGQVDRAQRRYRAVG